MQCSTLTFTRHAIERMFSRSIDVRSIEALIGSSEVIADYLDDKPYPSALLLGFINRGPVHVLVARDDRAADCYLATVYVPDSKLWNDDFRIRRK